MKKKKVFVGMSGGVDSSLSALLLKKAGFDVTGVFLRVWQPDFMHCTAKEDRRDAMRVAAEIDIPFITIDAREEYKEGVVDYMVNEYKSGRTPNPDVMCNNVVKFGLFLNKALEMGADYIATGHYARVNKIGDRNALLAGVDNDKDQSYFLWNIDRSALDKIIFPVGDLKKTEVRKLAKKYKLPNAEKKDSQGLCFIGKVSMKDFLSHFLNLESGSVLDSNGNVIGEHTGAMLYTMGQRHGFTITEKTPDDKAYFVISKDISANTITVSNKAEVNESFLKKKVLLEDFNWLCDLNSKENNLNARLRYRQELQKISMVEKDSGVEIIFENGQSGVSAGQSVVVYNGEIVLGGGIIKESYE